MRLRLPLILAALSLLVPLCPTALASPPSDFYVTTIASGFQGPTTFAYAPDGRIFVAEKRGTVQVVENGVKHLFIDLQDEVNKFGDRGLLGLALDPGFSANHRVYLLFSQELRPDDPDGRYPAGGKLIRVETSAMDPDVADPSTRVTLFSGFDSNHFSHSVGTLRFDPQGRLIVGLGDGASYQEVDPLSLRSYDKNRLEGKILRIDPFTGAGVPGNPYYNASNPDSVASKIIVRGVRNPFRFTIDAGRLIFGDVGWNKWEEINTMNLAGPWSDPDKQLNYGWPCYEGTTAVNEKQSGYAGDIRTAATCQTIYPPTDGGTGVGATAPIYSFRHTAGGGDAIVAGPVYHPPPVSSPAVPYPTIYNGKQFFANYARDTIWTWNPSVPGSEATEFGTPGDGTLGNFGAPVDLQISPTGNVAYIGIADKALHEIIYSPANAPPRAQASATPLQGASPLTVQFSSAGTSDPNGDTLTYRWDFGDGFISTSANPTHTFARGSYDVVLTVRDPSGAEATAGVPIDSGNTRPTVTFLSPSPSTTYRIGEAITLQMSGYDPEDGPLTGSHVTWNLILHHGNHLHPDAGGGTGTTATFVVPDHGDDSYLEFQAQSIDSLGAKSQVVSLILHPQTTPVIVDSIPPGAPIVVDGQDQVAPYGWESIPGGSHSVTAGPSFKRTKKNYTFSQWVANGTPSTISTYLFTTPDSPLSLQAQYSANIKLVTTPTGLQLVWDGIIVKGGSTVPAVPNSQHDLAAISPQAVNGLAYQFSSWSDGQGREHTLTAGEGGTITATFVRVDPSPGPPGTPTATISAPSGRKFKGRAGDVVTYSGSASDPEDGSLAGSALNWVISVKRGMTTSLVQIGTGSSGTFTIPAPFSGTDKVLVAVTAVDTDGRAGTASYSFGVAP